MKTALRFKPGAPVIALLSVAGAVAYVIWGFLPQRTELADLRQQIEEKQAAVAAGNGVAEHIAQATEEFLAAQKYCSAWSSSAPTEDSLITLFRDIDQLSQTAGARNLRLEPAAVETLAAVWRAPVHLSIEGTFPQLFQFVHGVETLSPAMDLASVEIERTSGDSESLQMTATLTIFGAAPGFSGYANLAD